MCLALFVQTLDPSVFATENLNQKNFRVKVKMDSVDAHGIHGIHPTIILEHIQTEHIWSSWVKSPELVHLGICEHSN